MSQEKQALPFFVRYLENQAEDMSAEELDEVSGAGMVVTQRYPSDGDDVDPGFRCGTPAPSNPFDLPSFEFPAFPANFPFNSNGDDTMHAL
jgi:Serine endopeptidase inhibitors